MSKSLDSSVYDQILLLSQQGEKFFEDSFYREAIEKYSAALALLPAPSNEWDASIWLNIAIGDSYFMLAAFEKALKYCLDAYNGPGGNANPFVNLRIGQAYLELDDSENAEEYLLRAYMIEGKDIFKTENKKYINFLQSKYNI